MTRLTMFTGADDSDFAADTSNLVRRAPARLLRVLVVDDDRDMTDTLTTLTRLWGHDVRSAYGGAEALRLASVFRPDVLLLDIVMPMICGFEVTRRLRGQVQFDDTWIIAISGSVDAAHQALCRQAGIDVFLAKPLDIANLNGLLMSERDRLQDFADAPPVVIGNQSVTNNMNSRTTYESFYPSRTCPLGWSR